MLGFEQYGFVLSRCVTGSSLSFSLPTVCEYLRDFRDKMEGTRDGMSLALTPPSCRPDGSFNDTQCHGAACWCVDSFGTEIPQTR